MSEPQIAASYTFGKRAAILVAVLAASIAMSLAVSTERASAEPQTQGPFCHWVWLSPWGQAGDHCYMAQSLAGHHFRVRLFTYERAGCIALTGYYGEQVSQWYCAAANAMREVYPPNNGGYYRAIIRITIRATALASAAIICAVIPDEGLHTEVMNAAPRQLPLLASS